MLGPMLIASALAIMLFFVSVFFHLFALRHAKAVFDRGPPDRFGGRLGAFAIILASHLAIALFFAVGLWAGDAMNLGGFAKEATMNVMDYYYYSLVNVTTLGLADITATGHLREIGGIGALTGFLLISCSAQRVFKMMQQQEEA